MTTLGPAQRLRFIGGGDVTVVAENNTILDCIDIVVNGTSSGVASRTVLVDCNDSLDKIFTLTTPYNVELGGYPQFVSIVDWGDGSVLEHDISRTNGTRSFTHTYIENTLYIATVYCTNWSIVELS